MKKRITSIFILLFMTLSAYSVPKHIEEDLKVFKKYMEQCYVAYDENVELGFDLDKTIKNIKLTKNLSIITLPFINKKRW